MKIFTYATRRALIGLSLLALAACGDSAATPATQSVPATQAVAAAAPTPTSGSPAATVAPVATAAATATIEVAPTATVNMAAPPAMAGVTVEAKLQLFAFSPSQIEVGVGTTVQWTNEDDIEHSVTSGAPPEGDGVIDSGFFTKGQAYSYTFTEPGTYEYFCRRHNSMTGSVIVK
jgi:plastocyanin